MVAEEQPWAIFMKFSVGLCGCPANPIVSAEKVFQSTLSGPVFLLMAMVAEGNYEQLSSANLN